MRSRRELLQSLSVATCLVASSVAVSGSKGKAPAVTLPNIVLASEILGAAPASPQRALLSWVQAVQFRDLGRVHRLTAPVTVARVGGDVLDRAVLTVGDTFARPRIISTMVRGGAATLSLLLLSYGAASRNPIQSIPAKLRLMRDASGWRMLDVYPLLPPSGAPSPSRTLLSVRGSGGR